MFSATENKKKNLTSTLLKNNNTRNIGANVDD